MSNDGRVRVVTIDNVAMRNALDGATRRALLDALRDALSSDCRAVVLTGAGDTFCSGGELSSMPTTDVPAVAARLGEMHEIVRLIADQARPFVAAVEGFAYGSGLSLAAACDHVVAATDARLCASFGRVGLVADAGLAWVLPRRVGLGPAKDMLLGGSEVTAVEAHASGLVDRLVEPGTALAVACEHARALASGAPLAIAAAKRLLARNDATLDDLLAAELDEQVALLASRDFAEGRAAFFEHRAPHFEGR